MSARKRLAVLGQPISHSLSPAMHNAALAALGMDREWSYEAIEVAPERFEQLVRSLPDDRFVGANVTVPHKLAALRVADAASEAARGIGAANTLSFVRGRIAAENTDAEGLLAALPEPARGKRALVLGAGGAARAAVWGLLREGAEVSIWNRTRPRAEALAAEFGATVIDPDPAVCCLRSGDFDLIVNATTVGLRPGSPPASDLKALRLGADSFSSRQMVVDLVYGPVETDLVRVARERGAATVDGREVLVYQGAASFRIWTGTEPPLEEMRKATQQR
jgi:shikimate dehydrogenase